MRRILLSQNQTALVDDDVYPLFVNYHWSYRPERNGAQGYAMRHRRSDGKVHSTYLHREIMQPGPNQDVIFLNYNRLDCRRENLKVVSKEEARQHHRVRRDSKTGIKGIRCNFSSKTWSAVCYRNGQCCTIGTFERRDEAVAAYQGFMQRENPALHAAPEQVSRPDNPQLVQQPKPTEA